MPPTTAESPPTLDESKLRESLENPQLTLDAIAKENNLTLDELLDWLERPETINRFQRMKRAEYLRDTLIVRQARRTGLEALQRAAVGESIETSRKAGDALVRATTRHRRHRRPRRDREAAAPRAPRQHPAQTTSASNAPTSSQPQTPPKSHRTPRNGTAPAPAISPPPFKHDYTPPVAAMLQLPEPDPAATTPNLWPDPASLGLSSNDVPQLIRLACDRPISYSNHTARFAPRHALRALAILNITTATPNLLDLLEAAFRAADEDFISDIIQAFIHVGPPILQELIYDITAKSRTITAHEANAQAITTILTNHPEEKTTALPQLKSLLKAQQNPAPHAASAAGEIRVQVLTKLIESLDDHDPG